MAITTRQYVLGTVLALLAAVIGLRVALPSLVKDYLNDRMATMGDYRGHIADVDIALLRGAYSLHDAELVKVDDNLPVPFFEADTIDLSVSWRALFRGAIVAEVDFIAPDLHFVDAENGEDQTGTGTDWREAVQQLVPIEIDRLGIHDGSLHFHNFNSDPAVHLALTRLEGQFTNISNTDRNEGPIPARFTLEGLMFENAGVELAGNLDPLGDLRNFIIAMRIDDIDLSQFHDLTEAYGNFDIESGNGSFVMELEATDGELTGYARPLLDNVVILDLEDDLEEGVLSSAWEAVVGAFGRIFRNQPRDRIASQIEIRGNLDDQDVSAWQAFLSVLRNAFVEAYDEQFGRE